MAAIKITCEEQQFVKNWMSHRRYYDGGVLDGQDAQVFGWGVALSTGAISELNDQEIVEMIRSLVSRCQVRELEEEVASAIRCRQACREGEERCWLMSLQCSECRESHDLYMSCEACTLRAKSEIDRYREHAHESGLVMYGLRMMQVVLAKRLAWEDAAETSATVRKEARSKRKQLCAELLERDGHVCRECGATGTSLQVDHIRPVNFGGTNSLENLQLLCRKCNASKSDSWLPL